ncbi:phage tail protein [Pseudomonas fluorescens]|uniref:Phage tail protein n=1 Tax=Pseudomonas fluorescens TaxID=294 RepID=A0A854XIQ8_PSEFL|nr:phage tail protein [Pseudomonas fluorescens]PCM49715.1 phage tail protein [Pseudomonas fluorescens]
MDYPNSVPSAGLVNGRFVDEDPIAGKPGSLIPASWGNGVTQELLNVIQAAGLTASEVKADQLLTALRSNRLFATPPQFDNSQNVATTGFVNRSGTQFSGFTTYATSAALTAAQAGGVVSFYSSTTVTATMPVTTSVMSTSTLTILNLGTGVLTINPAPNDRIVSSNTVGSLVLGIGDSAQLFRTGNDWRLYGGSVSDRFASIHSGVFGDAGYQRFSSGVIEQWGSAVSDANGDINVVFPIAFPNAFSNIVATHAGGDSAMVILNVNLAANKFGCHLKIRSYLGTVSAGWTVHYQVKGY